MDIVEFVFKVREQDQEMLRQIMFGFLGYVTLALAGLVLVHSRYSGVRRFTYEPRWNRLLILTFFWASTSCLFFELKFDTRKNFCTDWLAINLGDPSEPKADPNARNAELIGKFCKQYSYFDVGMGFKKFAEEEKKKWDKHMEEKYGKESCYWKICLLSQNEKVKFLSVLFVFVSAAYYGTAIRAICLRNREVRGFLRWTVWRWKWLNEKRTWINCALLIFIISFIVLIVFYYAADLSTWFFKFFDFGKVFE